MRIKIKRKYKKLEINVLKNIANVSKKWEIIKKMFIEPSNKIFY